jgi:hypothetical protein
MLAYRAPNIQRLPGVRVLQRQLDVFPERKHPTF